MISSDVINEVNKVAGTVMNSAVAAVGPDPAEFLHSQLASALSTFGDAQYWEETISPTTIRNELSASDPSNPNSTPILQKGMKWLLASISKGKDVSDFYPHVVKLVGATSLEVRKMVYMYLVQYADHDETTRNLSLLSINAFQKGLSDSEQLIRALALRVLSSIRINDILQIQILNVQKCATDNSPYVRKCAANALAKLVPRCDEMQREMMFQLMREQFLDKDTSTMVLTSALVAFSELCPDRLELLHTSYRKICHLLTDMDEWGQIVVVDILTRYCRKFFKEPRALKQGEAELIDQERRVHRRLSPGEQRTTTKSKKKAKATGTESNQLFKEPNVVSSSGGFQDVVKPASSGNAGSFRDKATTIIPRVTKGFYSDDEDESTDDEVVKPQISMASAMRQPPVTGNATSTSADSQALNVLDYGNADPDLQKLDPDHQLLLTSSMSLLKSRNAGVVLAVCSLHYYCGVSTIKARSSIGKALVRIHRRRREIQYVVLTSIRVLVRDCPSAFAPFLSDFFVKALDPPFTRPIKIDILVSLALEPAAIEAVLNELRSYIRHGDKAFATASIRAVGRVVEMTRIVFDRHGESNGMPARERHAACRVALDALYGLSVVTQASESRIVVGEAILVMQSILHMLNTASTLPDGSSFVIEDPNQVRSFAMRRILLLVANSLSNRQKSFLSDGNEESDDDEAEILDLQNLSIDLKPTALSSALWMVGEWMSDTSSFDISTSMQRAQDLSRVRQELLRLTDSCFPYFTLVEKEQAIHFASKIWLSCVAATTATSIQPEAVLCEHILAMGRLDVNPDVKDRARFESSLLHTSIGLKHDTSGIDERPGAVKLDLEQVKTILLAKKPASSYLPIESENIVDASSFRFGTLSSLVGHKARGHSTSLPPWAKKNSAASLREPILLAKQQVAKNFSDPGQSSTNRELPGFYDHDDDDSDDDSSDSGSSSSSSESSDSSSDESDSDSDDSSSSSDESDKKNKNAVVAPLVGTNGNVQSNFLFQPVQQNNASVPVSFESNRLTTATSDDSSSESDDDSSSDDSSDESDVMPRNNSLKKMQQVGFPNQTNGDGNLLGTTSVNGFAPNGPSHSSSVSNAMEDLKGLVMAPINVEKSNTKSIDYERDSSAWTQIVRPELCGGLSVKSRYLRGPTKDQQLKMSNINPSNTSAICIQLEFSNKKADSSPIRRIKVMPRSGTSGTHSCKKTLCPPEIMELNANKSISACLIFEFTSMSNRDGDIVGRIDVKQGYGGSVPIEFKPSLSELLLPPDKTWSVQEFDAAMTRMQGFQRVDSSYKTSLPIASIPQVVIKNSSFQVVGNALVTSDKKFRLIGLLPENKQPVMVKIEANNDGGKIVVCCDHVVVINTILSVVKRSICR
mmetsp:Transcript_15626/g.36015  ORF Transcript_15626/g.36015 Transcript_15626/m.36015 type:complete len:1375 (-) Transcript_15626:77-4201(-)